MSSSVPDAMNNPEEIDPDWGRYPETILRFEGTVPVEVDLREPLTEDIRNAIRRLGLSETFAIMTAHDPRGRDVSAAENRRRQSVLEGEIGHAGLDFFSVDACSPDGSHCECSVAVVTGQEAAIELAKRYEQVAIFWYDGDSFWILGAIVESDPLRLPRAA